MRKYCCVYKYVVLLFCMLGMNACVMSRQKVHSQPITPISDVGLVGTVAIPVQKVVGIGLRALGPLNTVIRPGGLFGYFAETRTGINERLALAGIQMIQLGDKITLVLLTDTFFAPNSARILPSNYATLQEIALLLKSYGVLPVAITAYSDDVGGDDYKKQLTQHQARRIMSYLWANGVNIQRMHAIGYGKLGAIASNNTVLGSGMNRRIEIQAKIV